MRVHVCEDDANTGKHKHTGEQHSDLTAFALKMVAGTSTVQYCARPGWQISALLCVK